MLAIASPTPVNITEVLQWSCLLDEYGVAGYGWGIAWTDGSTIHRYRSVDGIRRDRTAPRALQNLTMTRGYVHLRRPSLMTTIGYVNAQPYMTPENDWAFSHNGYLERHQEFRAQYQNRLQGTSDSEVGFHYWLDRVKEGNSVTQSLAETHQALGGKANLMALRANGELAVYAGNEENLVYRFRLGAVDLASTSLHSHDLFLFDTIFPGADDIERLAPGTAILMP